MRGASLQIGVEQVHRGGELLRRLCSQVGPLDQHLRLGGVVRVHRDPDRHVHIEGDRTELHRLLQGPPQLSGQGHRRIGVG